MKKITAFLLLFLLVFESLFTLTSCGGFKARSEMTIKYLTENDYLSGSFEDKLTDSITVGVDQKAYVVMDFTLKNLKKTKKKKDGGVLTAEF